MTQSQRILVAGIGNIFLGDDAFGVEVAQRLLRCQLPTAVTVVDFGIRSYDLAYALMQEYTAVILIDAVQRGRLPGTLYLIEPDWQQLEALPGDVVNSHSLNPARVLQLVYSWGGRPPRLYLIGCEPAVLETENGAIGLSPAVALAVPGAIQMVNELIDQILTITTDVSCTNLAS